MIKKHVRFGSRTKDILYVHGWIERPGVGPVCTSCQALEHESYPENRIVRFPLNSGSDSLRSITIS